MPERNPPRLCDFPQEIAALLPVLEQMYQPANLSDPAKMTQEDARLRLAADAGRHQVVLDFRAALGQAAREVQKPRVIPEVE